MAKDFVKIKGLKQLDKQLAALGSKMGFKALRGGMMVASRPMFFTARSNAASTGIKNLDAGATAAAMGRWTKKLTPTITVLFLGPKNKNRKALALYNAKHGTNVKRLNHFHLLEFGSVHGGAQPFLRPAFESKKISFIRSFGREVRKAIDKVVLANAR